MGNLRVLGVLGILVFAFAGCASIPLSTLLRLSSFDARSMMQIDPAEVRVKLSVSDGYEVDIAKSRLKLAMTGPDAVSHVVDMPLALLQRTTGKRSGGLFSPDVPVTTYELALAPEGAGQLRALQRALLTDGNGKFEFSVSAPLSKTPPKMKEVMFWADLKFSDKDSYLPLIDGATLRFKNEVRD